MGIRDKAAAFEEVPLGAAAARSRYNTYDEQNQAVRDIYQALASRGDIEASVQGQLSAAMMEIDQRGRLTPDGLAKMVAIAQQAADEADSPGAREYYIALRTKLYGTALSNLGIAPPEMSDFTGG
jgi:hypothetical protein